ncbi:MAG: hypothetical protein J5850_03415 [Clostridia bacterium]|nr:hypothetical protein [Clostridia bacterium]
MKNSSGKNGGKRFVTILLAVLFVLSLLLHCVKIFVGGVAKFYPLPEILGMDSDFLTGYFTSVVPVLVSALFILGSAALIVLISLKNKLDYLKTLGISCAVCAGINIVLCFTAKLITAILTDEVKTYFIDKHKAFCDLSMIFAIILIIIAAVTLSVRASLNAAKKKNAKTEVAENEG